MNSRVIFPLVGTAIFVAILPGLVVLYLPLRWMEEWNAWSLMLGLPLIASGAAIALPCFWEFAIVAHGTPAPIAPPRRLVTTRLYRHVRNPMYVGIALTLLGEATVFRSAPLLLYACGIWVLFHLFVVLYEEPTLSRKFGATYEAYRGRVPRWIPGTVRHQPNRRSVAGPGPGPDGAPG